MESFEFIEFECRVCQTKGNFEVHNLTELMYGTKQSFDYVRCSHCGCLQIAKIPVDLKIYYPQEDYYSMVARPQPPVSKGLKKKLVHFYAHSDSLRPNSIVTKILCKLLPAPYDYNVFGRYLSSSSLTHHSEGILDVGCGSNPHRLAAFRRCGFLNVIGIDPFIENDTEFQGVPVYRKSIEDLSGTFGLIMFHHSFEHVVDPKSTLAAAARILRPGGTCLVRVPVMDTYFWNRFRKNWVELDPPRHFHLLTLESMRILAQQCGFKLRKLEFDSSGWEIKASLLAEKGFPLRAQNEELV